MYGEEWRKIVGLTEIAIDGRSSPKMDKDGRRSSEMAKVFDGKMEEAILALLKVNADQGRLGGLFKLWLSGQSAPAAEIQEIRKLLAAIEECQLKLKGLIGGLSG